MPTQTGSIDFKSTKGFQSYASGQYTTKTEFDNLEIGGRNLLYKMVAAGGRVTANGDYSIILNASENADTYFTLYTRNQLVEGTTYVISCEASGINGEGVFYKFPLFRQGSTISSLTIDRNGINSFSFVMNATELANHPARTVDGLTVYAIMMDDNGRNIEGQTGPITLTHFKLEKGNKATDWTPAPEDVTERIVKAETAIEQTANNVLIKATQSDTTAAQGGQHLIESLINVAPSGVKIAASKVEIDGTAVFKAANAIPDTRSNNQPPSWYFTNYPRQSVTEFKTSSVMGLTGETYCYVTTVTGWNDSSGGYPKQTAQIGSKTYWRVGVSASAWSAWQETESTAGAQDKATEAVSNLEIGGRNLLLKSADLSKGAPLRTNLEVSRYGSSSTFVDVDGKYFGVSTSAAWQGIYVFADSLDLSVGDLVTFSCRIRTTSITGTVWYYTMAYNSSGTRTFPNTKNASSAEPIFTTGNAKKLADLTANSDIGVWLTMEWTQEAETALNNGEAFRMSFQTYSNLSGNGTVIFYAPKLEKGNKATDWSPAPEDVAASAVSRTQRIWYRKSAAGAPATPGTASSNWVVKADDGSNAWTKMHISITETEKFIYTCEQYEMGDGTVGYTSVLLDNTITVIDGGKIITGSVTANQIAAGTITGEQIAADTIEGGNIKGNAITAEHLSAAFSLDLGKVDGLKERLESIEGGVSRLQDNTQWVHYDPVAGTVFGESGSANNVTVKGGGIDFNTDEGRAAWATGGVFHANEMEAGTIDTQTITMGDWAIVQSGSSFYIDYIGS